MVAQSVPCSTTQICRLVVWFDVLQSRSLNNLWLLYSGALTHTSEGLVGGGGGSGIHYSLKILPIIHLIKIFCYSLK